LDIVKKIWAPLSKLFASWFLNLARAWQLSSGA